MEQLSGCHQSLIPPNLPLALSFRYASHTKQIMQAYKLIYFFSYLYDILQIGIIYAVKLNYK